MATSFDPAEELRRLKKELGGAQQRDRMAAHAGDVSDALYSAFSRTPMRASQRFDETAAAQQMQGLEAKVADRADRQDQRGLQAEDRRLALEDRTRKQGFETEDRQRKKMLESEDDDPDHPVALSAKGLLDRTYGPDWADPETKKKINLRQMKGLDPRIKGLLEFEHDKAKAKALSDKAEKDRQNKLDDLAEERKYQSKRDELQNAAAMERTREGVKVRGEAAQTKATNKAEHEQKEYFLEGYTLRPDALPKKEEAMKLRAAQSISNTMDQTAAEITALFRKNGAKVMPTADRARMETLVRELQLAAKGEEVYGLGVLTGPDLGLLESIIPNPTTPNATIMDFLGGNQTLAKMDALRGQLRRRFENKARAVGYQPAGSSGAPSGGGPTGAGGPPPTGGGAGDTVTIRVKATGKTKTFPRERAAKYLKDPDFEEVL